MDWWIDWLVGWLIEWWKELGGPLDSEDDS